MLTKSPSFLVLNTVTLMIIAMRQDVTVSVGWHRAALHAQTSTIRMMRGAQLNLMVSGIK